MAKSNVSIGLTNGVVLDPFSIHLTGLLRKNRGIKSDLKAQDLFALAHGEARFKQAFVNACHFAESMTVTGPVAQLTWDFNSPDYIKPALHWRAGLERAGNEYFAQSVQDFLTTAGWTSIPSERWLDRRTQELILHVLPDFSLSREIDSERELKRWGDHSSPLFQFLYRQSSGGIKFARDTVMARLQEEERKLEINAGAPVLGLMAVTFTFKKPAGVMSIGELTNLASWPPVTFFLPVLVPSGATLSNSGYTLVDNVLRQPPMATYRLSLNRDKFILPYGQPYLLTSVRNVGKAPDTLRSLSDVFKALWSQATLYSAWNMEFNADILNGKSLSYPTFDHSQWRNFIGEFSLEPLGAGRRIRGHNRYMSKHQISDVSFLWEDGLGLTSDADRKILGWNTAGIDKRPFHRQLRSDKRRGTKEAIFVLPSYMGEDMRDSLLPVAMGMAKFMFNPEAGLEVFLDSKTLHNLQVHEVDAEAEDETVRGNRDQSFVDCIAKAMNQAGDDQNAGALPLRRVKGDIAYDPDGDPSVFGLSLGDTVLDDMAQDNPDCQLSEEDYKNIVTKTGVLGNFHFLDAFCSKSTKDLTDVFGEVKKKSFKEGTKASKLLDDTLTIDLFDEDIGML
jgi:hypothetical protein